MLVSTTFTFSVAYFTSLALGLPLRREVPQEHSHEQFLTTVRASLNLNNPDQIQDPVFGLLGNAAASKGQGKITDTDCLQQATADQAFTNAKAAGDVNGQVAALIYRALERNTGGVGVASVLCTSIKAVNPEIAALQQHQDAASDNAAATNKQITLTLAQQIAAVGGNAQDALKAGTFAPGNKNDATGAGNTCDDANDPVGCIFTQNLLVEDATADEITAAVAGVKAGGSVAVAASASAAGNTSAPCPPDVTTTVDASAVAATTVDTASAAAATASAAGSASADAAAAPTNTGSLSFGKCTNPSVIFAAGLPGRKATEFSFEPSDLNQFNHGTALNPAIIFQFNCDTLVNLCGLTNADTAVQACRSAQTTASALGKTGAAADKFNGLLGFQTNFAALDAQAQAAGAAA